VIVLDASVLIAYLDAEDAEHRRAESLLAREIDDQFAANPLTLAEVLVGPARSRRLDEARLATGRRRPGTAPAPPRPAR
jgi:predicted nucleic acid-binding protein